jgi:hypothetical protein
MALIKTSAQAVLLNSQTASNDTILTFNSSLITSTYDIYILKFHNYQPSTDSNALHIRLSTDNGSTYQDSSNSYQKGLFAINSSRSDNSINSRYGDASSIRIIGIVDGAGNSNTETGSGTIVFYDLPSSKAKKIDIRTAYIDDTGNGSMTTGVVTFNNSSVVNNFKIYQSGGNIAQGTFSLFGVQT